MRRRDTKVIAYLVVLLLLGAALVWGIANSNSGC